MRFALVSIVPFRGTPFVSLLILETDERGISTAVGEIVKPLEDMPALLSDLTAYEINELQTDSKELYRELVAINYPIIYRKELEGTREQVTRNEDLIIELYELKLAKWRLWVIDKLEKVIKLIKTKGIKLNGN